MRLGAVLAAALFLLYPTSSPRCAQDESFTPLRDELRSWVIYLSSDDMKGRAIASPELEKAAQWIAQTYASIGLRPAVGEAGYFHEFTTKMGDTEIVQKNVIGVIGPDESRCHVLVSAHYDHIGVGSDLQHFNDPQAILLNAHPPHASEDHRPDDWIYNGADDNASGVAVMMGIAATLNRTDSLKAGACKVVFIAFTGEEVELFGSRKYARHPVFPLDEMVMNLNLEMVGHKEKLGTRALWMTSDRWTNFFDIMKRLGKERGWRVLGERLKKFNLWAHADSLSFLVMAAEGDETVYGVPAHTISTWGGETHYHEPGDEWASLDYKNMEGLTLFLSEVIRRVAASEITVQFVDEPVKAYGKSVSLKRFRAGCLYGAERDACPDPPGATPPE